jgi:hypothetical protein
MRPSLGSWTDKLTAKRDTLANYANVDEYLMLRRERARSRLRQLYPPLLINFSVLANAHTDLPVYFGTVANTAEPDTILIRNVLPLSEMMRTSTVRGFSTCSSRVFLSRRNGSLQQLFINFQQSWFS